MRDRVAIFDTNVFGPTADLQSPLWVTVSRLCDDSGIEACLPEIVLHEAINLRRDKYAAASARFLAAFKQVSRFFEAEGVYVPDPDGVAEEWEAALRQTFKILPTQPDLAAEALKREALRQAPARLGRGGRDSLIWLTASDLARAGRDVLLVTRNTKDFTYEDSGTLHPALAGEVKEGSGDLQFFNGLDAFIESVASKVDPPAVDSAAWAEVLELEIRSAVLELPNATVDDEELALSSLELSDAVALRAYEVHGRGLALVKARARLVVEGSAGLTGGHSGAILAWIGYDLASGAVTSGDLQRYTPDEQP